MTDIMYIILGVVLFFFAIFLAIKDAEDQSNMPTDPVVQELRRQWLLNQVSQNINRQVDRDYNNSHHYHDRF